MDTKYSEFTEDLKEKCLMDTQYSEFTEDLKENILWI